MAGEVTATDLQNAKIDVDDLADIVNGSATLNGTGLVATRLGGSVKTISKALVDAAAQNNKQMVRAATTANGTLASAFDNGSTIDDVVLATNDRILIKDQSSGAVNGIYIVQASGAPVRATDADTAAELGYAMVRVREGTVNAGVQFWCEQAPGSITLNTTALVFTAVDDQSGLNTRLDDVEADAATLSAEVVAARGGEASLDDRLDNIEAKTDEIAVSDLDWEWAVRADDGDGEVLAGQKNGAFLHTDSWRDRQAKNIEFARHALSQRITTLAAWQEGINCIIEGGQSKAAGSETWPVKSIVAVDGNLMPGKTVRSSSTTAWTPFPGDTFDPQPLVANIMDTDGTLFTDMEIAAFTPGDTSGGEPGGIGASNLFKLVSNQRRGVATDPDRILMYNNWGQGGREMAELQKDHEVGSVEYYGVYLDYLDDSKAWADGETLDWQVLALLWNQGQTESINSASATKSRDEFKSRFGIIHQDMVADALAAGNTKPPGLFYWQVGAGYTRAVDAYGLPDMAAQMAQIEYALENRDSAFLIGPEYPYSNKGGNHFDSNGSRNAGLKAALVMDRVINQRLSWLPLIPIAAEMHGTWLYVHFSVPVGPLRWGTPYRNYVAQDIASKGFRVTYLSTNQIATTGTPIIIGPTTVAIKLVGLPFPNGQVSYAPESYNGYGNLRDSETVDPLYVHEYVEGSGDYAEADIEGITDEPYDMSNWACQFKIPISMERLT